MKAAGIIAEYNPFHNGHIKHIDAVKALTGRDNIVAVMSGGFVQRGEPAIFPKRRRVADALLHGVDVVLELPTFYSAASADYFARGAVKILTSLGTVDSICFGSECGDISTLKSAAEILTREPASFKILLKENLSSGMSFASARGKAVGREMGKHSFGTSEDLLAQPNNTLGIEYIKAAAQMKSPIEFFTFKREQSRDTAPASFIRSKILSGHADEILNYLPCPANADGFLNPRCLDDFSGFFKTFLYRAKVLYRRNLFGKLECVLNTPDMAEGLENRFLHETCKYEKLSEALSAIKTKRYTLTRLQRTALHLIIGITKGDMDAIESAGGPRYIRLLGFRKDKARLVNELAASASLPFIAGTAAARKVLPPFALSVFERETEIGRPEPVIKV